jgi:pilus assembly protein FimV
LTKPSQHLLITLLTCGLLAVPFAARAEGNTAAGKVPLSQGASVITEDALHAWFKEQDKVLDEILVRLSRIESLVADIHQLLIRLPDYGQTTSAPPPVVALSAPAAQPAASAPAPAFDPTPAPVAEAKPGFLDKWLPQLAGAGLLALLLFWWSRRRASRQMPAPDEFPEKNLGGDNHASTLESHATEEQPAHVLVTAPVAAKPTADLLPKVALPAPDTEATVRSAPAFTTPAPSSQSDQALELAEIMLAMGLGSGAAQTLAEQIQNEPKQALRHWLKLLEIYRKNGQQEEFERSAEELRQHFNVQPEDWKAGAETYRGLESFPHIAKRLTDLWRKPDCLIYMQNLLDDNRGGARAGFPQTVAEELLLLTGMLKSEDGPA